jgi:competence protein ComEC
VSGDVEKDRERMLVQYWGDQLHSNWLLAAHHGSKTSTTGTFLKRVQPELAIISSGYANRFRHPHASVVERLSRHGVKILSTANSGALEFGFAPSEPMQVTAYREAERRYWK